MNAVLNWLYEEKANPETLGNIIQQLQVDLSQVSDEELNGVYDDVAADSGYDKHDVGFIQSGMTLLTDLTSSESLGEAQQLLSSWLHKHNDDENAYEYLAIAYEHMTGSE